MRFVVSGGDARFLYLAEMLRGEGYEAAYGDICEGVPDADCVITACPLNGTDARAFSGKTLMLFGKACAPEGLPEDTRVVKLLDDPILANENAVLTAEGAIAAAMARARFAVTGSRVMVIGYGRIGRALTEFLIGLRAIVTVVSRREQGRLQAFARGAYAASVENMHTEMADQKIVFVTSPERVLSEADLWYIPTGAIVMDLSGAPYGVDADCARAKMLGVTREPGLPGRHCPQSAARAILGAVQRALLTGGE